MTTVTITMLIPTAWGSKYIRQHVTLREAWRLLWLAARCQSQYEVWFFAGRRAVTWQPGRGVVWGSQS